MHPDHPSPFPPNRKFPSNPAIFFESKIPPYLLIAHRPVEHVHGPIQQLHIRPLCTQIQYLKHLRFRFRGHGRLDCSRISRIRSGRRDQRPPTRGGQRRTTSGSWYGVGVYETNARRSKRRSFVLCSDGLVPNSTSPIAYRLPCLSARWIDLTDWFVAAASVVGRRSSRTPSLRGCWRGCFRFRCL